MNLLILLLLVGSSQCSLVVGDDESSIHPMYRVHDESTVSMHKLMVLQDGEACDGEYAAKLDSLLKEMNKNKYASEDMAINLDEQFKLTMESHAETMLCNPKAVCEGGRCKHRGGPPAPARTSGESDHHEQETQHREGHEGQKSPAEVLGAMWRKDPEPPLKPMYRVHDEATVSMHKIMVIEDGDTCDIEYAGKLEDLMTEMNENKDALPLQATILDARFKSTMRAHPDTLLCNPHAVCDFGKCRPRTAEELKGPPEGAHEGVDEDVDVGRYKPMEGDEDHHEEIKKKYQGRSFKGQLSKARHGADEDSATTTTTTGASGSKEGDGGKETEKAAGDEATTEGSTSTTIAPPEKKEKGGGGSNGGENVKHETFTIVWCFIGLLVSFGML